jgi:hypothetical protein
MIYKEPHSLTTGQQNILGGRDYCSVLYGCDGEPSSDATKGIAGICARASAEATAVRERATPSSRGTSVALRTPTNFVSPRDLGI